MALTTAQRIRVKIQDAPVLVDRVLYGDGTASSYLVPHVNLADGTAYVPGVGGWSATGATFNPSGLISFATAISANSAFRVVYAYSHFSDDEIDQFLADGGSVLGAAVEAAQALMFDGLKRSRWMASDGSSYDDLAGQAHVRAMYEQLRKELEIEALASGGFQSWSENQAEW